MKPSAILEAPFEAAKPEETLPLLQSAVNHASRLQCWSPGQKHSYSSRIVKVNELQGVISISVSKETAGGAAFESALISEAIEEIYFSLHLPTDIVFFKALFRRGDSDFFSARVKTPVFKTQRRQAMRLPVSGANSRIHLRLASGRILEAVLLNFSEGGVGISMKTKEDFDLLVPMKTPITLSFEVHGVAVSAIANVRHGFEVGGKIGKKAYRLGMSFTVIDSKLRDRLSQVVLEESSKFIGRY